MRSIPKLMMTVVVATGLVVAGHSEADALMMQQEEALEGGGGGYYPPPAPATYNKIVYLHGRSMNSWPNEGKLQASASWNHVISYYDGSARMHDANVQNTVRSAIQTNCTGNNQCAIVCYSAGCARMLLAFDQLAAAGTPANRVTWITATASAAGGTKVADAATKWYVKVLSKIFGGYAPIDDDLKVGMMRSNYGFIQNRAPVPMYHLAGNRDMCKKILWVFKLCGNAQLPGRVGDGAVGPDSACGFAGTGYFPNCNAAYGSKYTNRYSQQDALFGDDHRGMVANGVRAASIRLYGTSTIANPPPFAAEDGLADANTACDDADEAQTSTEQLTDTLGGSNVASSTGCQTCTIPGACGAFSRYASGSGTAVCQLVSGLCLPNAPPPRKGAGAC